MTETIHTPSTPPAEAGNGGASDTSTWEYPPGTVKMEVIIPGATVETLRKLADIRDIPMTQALTDALALAEFVAEETKKHGAKLLLRRPGGPLEELHVD